MLRYARDDTRKKWPLRGSTSEVYGFSAKAVQVVSDAPFALRATEDRQGVEVSGPEIRLLKPSVSDNLLKQLADIGFRI
jgi:hypothetical protein